MRRLRVALLFIVAILCAVGVTGYGTLSRITQGDPPVLSAPHRYVTSRASTVLLYYPLDDGPDSTSGRPVIGDKPLTPNTYDLVGSAVTWGQGQMAPWLGPVLETKGTVSLRVDSPKVGQVTDFDELTLDIMRRATTDPAAFVGYADIHMKRAAVDATGVYHNYLIYLEFGAPLTVELIREDDSVGTPTVMDTGTEAQAEAGWDGRPHHWRIVAAQNGADVDVTVYLDGALIMSGTHSSVTLVRPTVEILAGNTDSARWGELVLWDSVTSDVGDIVDACFGYPGAPR